MKASLQQTKRVRAPLCAFFSAMAVSGALVAMPALAAKPIACADLKTKLSIADTTITLTEMLPAGVNPNPVGTIAAPICRVVGVTKPAVQFEVWMPSEGWNGKFQMVGNGGTAGVISYSAMRLALTRGYATASTDTGHVSSGSFDSTSALGRPDLIAEFGHPGPPVTTANGQAITRAYYGEPAKYSYYVGCSKGGQQGLMEAQRYPEDFDGLIACDPANHSPRLYPAPHPSPPMTTLPHSHITSP